MQEGSVMYVNSGGTSVSFREMAGPDMRVFQIKRRRRGTRGNTHGLLLEWQFSRTLALP